MPPPPGVPPAVPNLNALHSWVISELFPWVTGVETAHHHIRTRIDKVKEKLDQALQRVDNSPPVYGKAAPTIYDELAMIRETLKDLRILAEEWPDYD